MYKNNVCLIFVWENKIVNLKFSFTFLHLVFQFVYFNIIKLVLDTLFTTCNNVHDCTITEWSQLLNVVISSYQYTFYEVK